VFNNCCPICCGMINKNWIEIYEKSLSIDHLPCEVEINEIINIIPFMDGIAHEFNGVTTLIKKFIFFKRFFISLIHFRKYYFEPFPSKDNTQLTEICFSQITLWRKKESYSSLWFVHTLSIARSLYLSRSHTQNSLLVIFYHHSTRLLSLNTTVLYYYFYVKRKNDERAKLLQLKRGDENERR
jgi:hypothetical protein